MPAATATSALALSVSLFRESLAKCAAFQTFVGATGNAAQKEAAALLKIYAWDDGGVGVRPLAVVSHGDGFTQRRFGYGAHESSGTILLQLEGAYDDTEGVSDAYMIFLNALGDICEEVLNARDANPTAASVALNGYTLQVAPTLLNEKATEDDDAITPANATKFWLAIAEFTFGLGA